MEIHEIILFFATMVALLGMFYSTSFTTPVEETNLQPLNLTGCNDLRFETANATFPGQISTEIPSNTSFDNTLESKIRTGCSFKTLENLDEKESKLVYDMFLLLNPTDRRFDSLIPWKQKDCDGDISILVSIMYGAKQPSITTSIGNKTEAYKSILNLFAHLSCLSDKINMCIDMYEVDHAASVKALDYILRNRERANRLLINDFKAINWGIFKWGSIYNIAASFQKAIRTIYVTMSKCKDKHGNLPEYNPDFYLKQFMDETTFCKLLKDNHVFQYNQLCQNTLDENEQEGSGDIVKIK